MNVKSFILKVDIVLCAIIITVINIGLAAFIQDKLNQEIFAKIFTDIAVIIIAGYIGKHFASKVGFPLWWHRNIRISLKRQFITLAMLGLAIIVPNTILYYFNQNLLSTIPWLHFSNLKEVVLLSLRAGLLEEILFRLFLFTFVTYLGSRVTKSKQKSVIVGLLVSSFLFGFMHGGVNLQASIYGGILVYVYYKNGLIPAIIIHFLADAIPWTLLYILR